MPGRRENVFGSLTPYTLNSATQVFEELETPTEIWVAAFEGLYKISPRKHLFDIPLVQPFDLEKGVATGMSCYGIAEAGGWLWFIGDRALWKAPPDHPEQANKMVEVDLLSATYGLTTDRQGWLLPGLYNDWFLRLDPAKNYRTHHVRKPFGGYSRSHLQLPGGKIWAAMEGGILELDPETGSLTPIENDSIVNVWHFFHGKKRRPPGWRGKHLGRHGIRSFPPRPPKTAATASPPISTPATARVLAAIKSSLSTKPTATSGSAATPA